MLCATPNTAIRFFCNLRHQFMARLASKCLLLCDEFLLRRSRCVSRALTQTIALVSSLLITTTGVLLVLGSLCKPICQRCWDRARGRRSGKGVAATPHKLPQWADANSYYMATRFWVAEQPYFSAAPKELHPKVYFAW